MELCTTVSNLRNSLVIILLSLAFAGNSQQADTAQSIFAGKKSADVSYDSRNSFIDNRLVSVQSLKGGIVFSQKIAFGAGYAWLSPSTPIYNPGTFYDADLNKNVVINKKLSLQYFCLYMNYIYHESKRWEFSVPIQMGVGWLGYNYQYRGKIVNENEGLCFLYEPEVNVKFKIFRWLGVEGDVGYRLLFKNNRFIKNTFNSPLLSVGAFIVWNEVFLMTFPKSKWVQKKFGPSEW
jgi:hypothetical protein